MEKVLFFLILPTLQAFDIRSRKDHIFDAFYYSLFVYRLSINMNVMVMEITKMKVLGLLFAVGCVTTVVWSYPVVTSWWQQLMNCPAVTVGRSFYSAFLLSIDCTEQWTNCFFLIYCASIIISCVVMLDRAIKECAFILTVTVVNLIISSLVFLPRDIDVAYWVHLYRFTVRSFCLVALPSLVVACI